MGNLVLHEEPHRHVFAAYRNGKYVGIVLYIDLVDGKKRLHRGRRARRGAMAFRRTRTRFPDATSRPPHVVRWLGLS